MKEDKIPRGQTEERKAYMKQYNITHPRKDRSEYKREYDKKNKEKNDLYREKNKDRIKKTVSDNYIKTRD